MPLIGLIGGIAMGSMAAASGLLVIDDIAGCGEAGDDPKALRSVTPSVVAMSRRRTPGSRAMQMKARARGGRPHPSTK